MRIGINALYLIPGGVGGTEIYLRSLLEALARVDQRNEYVVFLNSESVADAPIQSPRFRLVDCRVRAVHRPARILFEQTLLPLLLNQYKVDVCFNPGFTMPIVWGGPSVTVFHDLQHKRHPEFFRWYELPFWNLLLWAAARRSKALIAISEATARDLERYYPGTAGKTVTIPHGVDPEFFRIGQRRPVATREKYLLTVSTLHPHKNFSPMMQAFKLFHDRHPEFRLMIVGIKGFATVELQGLQHDLQLDEAITFTGWIARERVYELFERADAYISASRFEGFGMTILEALAAGLPTACSRIAPLTQIAGPCPAYFDPDSVPGMLAAMEIITSDENFRARALTDGPRRASRFDWQASAARTLEALESTRQEST